MRTRLTHNLTKKMSNLRKVGWWRWNNWHNQWCISGRRSINWDTGTRISIVYFSQTLHSTAIRECKQYIKFETPATAKKRDVAVQFHFLCPLWWTCSNHQNYWIMPCVYIGITVQQQGSELLQFSHAPLASVHCHPCVSKSHIVATFASKRSAPAFWKVRHRVGDIIFIYGHAQYVGNPPEQSSKNVGLEHKNST